LEIIKPCAVEVEYKHKINSQIPEWFTDGENWNPEENEFEVIEFEIQGVVVNRITKRRETAQDHINFFYKKYPNIGQAFIIRESRMNFKTLLEQNAKYRA
jgi:hypothetical protein